MSATGSSVSFVPPYESRVNALPQKEQANAMAASMQIQAEIEVGRTRQRKLHAAFWASAPSMYDLPDTRFLRDPTPSSESGRTISSGRVTLESKRSEKVSVSVSPAGNAFTGEHFWSREYVDAIGRKSSFSSEDTIEGAIQHRPECLAKAAYAQVIEDIKTSLREQKLARRRRHSSTTTTTTSSSSSSERPTKEDNTHSLDEQVAAAKDVLRTKQAEFETLYDPVNARAVMDRLRNLHAEERALLAAYAFKHRFMLLDFNRWLHVDESLTHISTILDYAHDELRALRARARKTELLAPSPPALQLVFALWLLEEKTRCLKEEDEELEYGLALKSIQEEIGAIGLGLGLDEKRGGMLRRQLSERVVRMRREKGRAPNWRDLAVWAEELQEMEGVQEC